MNIKSAFWVMLVAAASCGGRGETARIAGMKNKLLSVGGILREDGFLGLSLIADDCPMLRDDAFVRVNGIPQTVDHGDNTGPGYGKGPCYFPGASVQIPEQVDLGSPLVIEVGDESQIVRAVLAPLAAGRISLSAPQSEAAAGGEFVVPFTWERDPDAPPAFYASARFEDADVYGGVYWFSSGVIESGHIRFPIPRTAAPLTDLLVVEVGLFSDCENAVCDGSNLSDIGSAFQPPPVKNAYSVTVLPP